MVVDVGIGVGRGYGGWTKGDGGVWMRSDRTGGSAIVYMSFSSSGSSSSQ